MPRRPIEDNPRRLSQQHILSCQAWLLVSCVFTPYICLFSGEVGYFIYFHFTVFKYERAVFSPNGEIGRNIVVYYYIVAPLVCKKHAHTVVKIVIKKMKRAFPTKLFFGVVIGVVHGHKARSFKIKASLGE